jgi:hypothetical protein
LRLALCLALSLCAACGDATSTPGPRSIAALKADVEAKLPAVAAQFAGAVPISAAEVYPVLDRYLEANPDFFGSTLAVDPSRVPGGIAPYVYRNDGKLVHKDLALVPGYDFPNQPWYAQPKASNAPLWSDPYFDAGGGEINMITYSIPVESGGSFLGILTTDVGIDGRPAR